MLPHEFDPDVEEVTLKILASLSRYENVDDLGDETISQILVNQALRQRLRTERDIDRQTKLVRDAIIEQVEQAKEALKRAQTEKDGLNATLLEEQSKRQRLAEDLENERAAAAEKQRKLAGDSATVAEGLQGKISNLEEELRRSQEAGKVAQRERERDRFVYRAVAGLIGGLIGSGAIGYAVGPFLGLPAARGLMGAAALWLAAWIQLTHWRGQKSDAVREWPLFSAFCRWRGLLWTGIGAILIGVVSNRVYDLLKALGF